jgi:two-component system response regulator YesN
MPLFSGLELLEAMRSQQINIPVVMLTAYDSFDYAQQCIRLNAVQYLMKPIRYQELTSTFSNLYIKLEEEKELKQERYQSFTDIRSNILNLSKKTVRIVIQPFSVKYYK